MDNWILELAFCMLHNDYETAFSDRWETKSTYPWELRDDPTKPTEYQHLIKGLSWSDDSVKSIMTALLQVLDLLIINDYLVYEYEYSYSWKDFSVAKSLEPLLHQVRLGSHLKRKLILNTNVVHFSPDSSNVVRQGAIHYLALSRLLGICYWPSPKRAKYLKQQSYTRIQSSFVLKFQEFMDENLENIVSEIINPLKVESNLFFSGFSATVLASCDTASAIVPTLFQVRQSSASLRFREWLRDMDIALQKGDLKHIAKEMKNVNDVIHDIRKDLGLRKDEQETVEFQIGISPSLVLDKAAVNSIFNHFAPKPYHLVFIRNHFSKFLESADIKNHLFRLFPYIR